MQFAAHSTVSSTFAGHNGSNSKFFGPKLCGEKT